MKGASYAVTRGCNQQSQHWCGELRGYAVTRGSYMCVRAQVRVWARVHACACDAAVTAKPRNSLGVARVSWLRVRATA